MDEGDGSFSSKSTNNLSTTSTGNIASSTSSRHSIPGRPLIKVPVAFSLSTPLVQKTNSTLPIQKTNTENNTPNSTPRKGISTSIRLEQLEEEFLRVEKEKLEVMKEDLVVKRQTLEVQSKILEVLQSWEY